MDCIVHEGHKESDRTERLSLSLSTFFQGFPGDSAVKKLPAIQETGVQSLGWEDSLEKEMVIHCSTLAWEILWTEELAGYSPWGHKE